MSTGGATKRSSERVGSRGSSVWRAGVGTVRSAMGAFLLSFTSSRAGSAGLDGDLARSGTLGPRHAEQQQAVAGGGADPVRVDLGRQLDRARVAVVVDVDQWVLARGSAGQEGQPAAATERPEARVLEGAVDLAPQALDLLEWVPHRHV